MFYPLEKWSESRIQKIPLLATQPHGNANNADYVGRKLFLIMCAMSCMLSDSLYFEVLFWQVHVTTWNTLTVATEIAFLEEIHSLTSVSKNCFKGLFIEKNSHWRVTRRFHCLPSQKCFWVSCKLYMTRFAPGSPPWGSRYLQKERTRGLKSRWESQQEFLFESRWICWWESHQRFRQESERIP